MTTAAVNINPIQNIGIIDRLVRFVIGAGLVGTVVLYYRMDQPVFTLFGQVLLIVIALYPLWTCNTGWDPFYAVFGLRSGNSSGRNQCGTFPYQFMAAIGRSPKYCDISDERSLEACHNEEKELPLHPVWGVDREPIMYPDGPTLDEFFRTHPGPGAKDSGNTVEHRSGDAGRPGDRKHRGPVRTA